MTSFYVHPGPPNYLSSALSLLLYEPLFHQRLPSPPWGESRPSICHQERLRAARKAQPGLGKMSSPPCHYDNRPPPLHSDTLHSPSTPTTYHVASNSRRKPTRPGGQPQYTAAKCLQPRQGERGIPLTINEFFFLLFSSFFATVSPSGQHSV